MRREVVQVDVKIVWCGGIWSDFETTRDADHLERG